MTKEKLNVLKKYFKDGIKNLLENPESVFEQSGNVQEAIFKNMPKAALKLLKEMKTQYGDRVVNETMTGSMTELLVESPMVMADLLKSVVDYTAKLEGEAEGKRETRAKFRELVKEAAEKKGKPGSDIVLGLDYRENLEYRIGQLEKMLVEE